MRDLRFFSSTDSGSEETVLFQNSSSASWCSGNFSWGTGIGHFTTYANLIHVVELPNSAGKVKVERVVNSTFTMAVYFSEEGVNFRGYNDLIGNSGGEMANTQYKYLVIMLYDRPTLAQARAEDITVTYTSYNAPIFNSLYSLSNYTMDGTANTAINTGLSLCGGSYDSWSIHALVSFKNQGGTAQASYLRCRAQTTGYPGVSIRRSTDSSVQLQINGSSSVVTLTNNTPYQVNINYLKGVGATIFIDNTILFLYAAITHTSPFSVGGELDNSLNWISGRFGKETIHNLVVYNKA